MFREPITASALRHVQFRQPGSVKLKLGISKFRGRRPITDVESVNGVISSEAKAFHGTMGHIEQWRKVVIVAIGQQQNHARDEADLKWEMFF